MIRDIIEVRCHTQAAGFSGVVWNWGGGVSFVHLSSFRVDTMVELLDMDQVKRSGSTEQRLASLEEQVGR